MKTIKQIFEAWDAAPTLRDKDVLVAKAVYGMEGILACPNCGSEIGSSFNDDTYCMGECRWRGRYSDGILFPKNYTTDPTAALQAMKDVGMLDEKSYPVAIIHNNEGWQVEFVSKNERLVKPRKLTDAFPTFAEACAFAAYAFSELKQKEGVDHDEG